MIARVALRFARYLNDDDVRSDVMGISSGRSVRPFKRGFRAADGYSTGPVYRDAIPGGLVWSAATRILDAARIGAIADWRYSSSLRQGDVAYLWPGAPLPMYREARARGCIVVTERINTLVHTSHRILAEEHRALGLPPPRGFTEAAAADEREMMELADFIFSPSPAVRRSLLDAGIPESKILSTSYGLDPDEILGEGAADRGEGAVTAVFAGTICVRKGVHLLLEAWQRADVDGRLLVVGRVSDETKAFFSQKLSAHKGVVHLEFRKDLSRVLDEADFFVLPSLEEGSPLVTYLAMGASLPCVVSPMGAGGIVENGKQGLVVDPHRVSDVAAAIRALACDRTLRRSMAEAARATAPSYTWRRVGEQRRRMLLARLDRAQT